ncbi:Uncharacterized protein K02A2.6, partial [Paramuricea clavata]
MAGNAQLKDSAYPHSTTQDSQPPSTNYDQDSTDSEEYSFNIHATNTKEQNKQSYYAKVKPGKSTIKFQIDSGSTANIIDEVTFANIQKENPSIQLTKSKKRLFAFGAVTPLQLLANGQFHCVLESKKRLAYATIIVVKNATGCLLSGKTSIDLNFLTIRVNKVTTKPATFSQLSKHKKLPDRLRPVISEFDEVFHGVGKLKDVQKVAYELERLQQYDIIEPAQGPTLWVSPIVAFPKPNNPEKLRLCVDIRQANTAILRERHPQPTIEDLLNDLNEARYFSKLDLTAAYHQLELDKQSRYITTFTTQKGLFQFKRLNFGTNSASEIFQNTIQNVFNGIYGCRNISDDLIIFGKTPSEHDEALRKVLQVAKERNLRFGFEKCEFDKKHLEFFGYTSLVKVKYCPGPTNPSDYLSRHPLPNYYNTNTCKTPNLADDHIRFIAQNAVPIALGIEQLRKAVKQDSTLQALIEILQNNTWNSLATKQPDNTDIDLDELKAFKKIQHELSLTSDVDLILRENRLVIPKQLRKQVIQLAHEGHQGLVKTKKLIREKVWFPGIDALAAKAVKDCLACQSVGQPAKLAPLNPLPIPLQAWDTLYVDFLGPLSSKDLLLVVIDGRTRFPEVAIVRSTNAKSTITSLNRIFATHGLPRRIISDNGPPFQSEEFRHYMITNGITHHKITPLWPQANAEAENFMKPLTKCLQTAVIDNKDWKEELQLFLLNYRATPHCTTKVPPATALFGRNIRRKLSQQPSR